MFYIQPVKARGGGKEVQMRLNRLESLNYGFYYLQAIVSELTFFSSFFFPFFFFEPRADCVDQLIVDPFD